MRIITTIFLLSLSASVLSSSSCDSGEVCTCDSTTCRFDCGKNDCDKSILVCEEASDDCRITCDEKGCDEGHIECHADECDVRCEEKQSCRKMQSFDDAQDSKDGKDSNTLTGNDNGIYISDESKEGLLTCSGEHSCKESSALCKAETCNVNCNGKQACFSSTIAANSKNGVTISCSSEQACKEGSLSCEGETCTMTCNDKQSCFETPVTMKSSGLSTLECSAEQACKSDEIRCDGENCNIDCTDKEACMHAQLDLESDQKTDLKCEGEHACMLAEIECEGPECVIGCGDNTGDKQSCQQATITSKATTSTDITCQGEQACLQAEIRADSSSNGAVTIDCTGTQPCLRTEFRCPTNDDCTIKCDGVQSCLQATIKCPSSLPSGKRCHLICEGNGACHSITSSEVSGDLSVECVTNSACSDYLLGLISTPPTPTGEVTSCPSGTECHCSNEPCLVTCAGSDSCDSAVLACPNSASVCHMTFSGTESGEDSHIECLASDTCRVLCTEHESCKSLQGYDDIITSGSSTGGVPVAVGKNYGIYIHTADEGIISCSHDDSCVSTSMLCAAKKCDITCVAGACDGASFNAAATTVNGVTQSCATNGCRDATFNFGDAQSDVAIACNGNMACFDASVTFPPTHTGSLHCIGSTSCKDISVSCQSHTCSTQCSGQNSCESGQFTAAASTTTDIVHTCNNINACLSATLSYQAAQAPVEVRCTAQHSCNHLTVTCPTTADCHVICEGEDSCAGLSMACPAHSTNCKLTCTGDDSCKDVARSSLTGDVTTSCLPNAGCSQALLDLQNIVIDYNYFCDVGLTCDCNQTTACYRSCDASNSCDGAVLLCGGQTTVCDLTLVGDQSAMDSHIHCLSSYSCAIKCDGSESCRSMNPHPSVSMLPSGFDPTGATVGIFISDAHSGVLSCSGPESCEDTSFLCASTTCAITCSGVQSCKSTSGSVQATTSGVDHVCSGFESCKDAIMDYTTSTGKVEIECSGKESCEDSVIKCPPNTECIISCTGEDSCEGVTLHCPNHDPNHDHLCLIDCIGSGSCGQITDNMIFGSATSYCSDVAACTVPVLWRHGPCHSYEPRDALAVVEAQFCDTLCFRSKVLCFDLCKCHRYPPSPPPPSLQCASNVWVVTALGQAQGSSITDLWCMAVCPFTPNDCFLNGDLSQALCECDNSAPVDCYWHRTDLHSQVTTFDDNWCAHFCPAAPNSQFCQSYCQCTKYSDENISLCKDDLCTCYLPGQCGIRCEQSSCRGSKLLCDSGLDCSMTCADDYSCSPIVAVVIVDDNDDNDDSDNKDDSDDSDGKDDKDDNDDNNNAPPSAACRTAAVAPTSPTFSCNNNQRACSLACSGYKSCAQTSSSFLSYDASLLVCDGVSSCHSSTHWCTSPSCEYECSGFGSCQGAAITASASDKLVVTCDDTHSCKDTVITCPSDSNDCTVTCSGFESCLGMQLHCSQGQECHIRCTGARSCQGVNLCNSEGNVLSTCTGERACTGELMSKMLLFDPASCDYWLSSTTMLASDNCNDLCSRVDGSDKYCDPFIGGPCLCANATTVSRFSVNGGNVDMPTCASPKKWRAKASRYLFDYHTTCDLLCSVDYMQDEDNSFLCRTYCECSEDSSTVISGPFDPCYWSTKPCDAVCSPFPHLNISYCDDHCECKPSATYEDCDGRQQCGCQSSTSTCSVQCDEICGCVNSDITCSDGDSCQIDCDSTYSCASVCGSHLGNKVLDDSDDKDSVLNDHKDHDDHDDASNHHSEYCDAVFIPNPLAKKITCETETCGISCSAPYSCSSIHYECTARTCSVDCSEFQSCANMYINTMTAASYQSESLTVDCSGAESCAGSTIMCPSEGDCLVICNGFNACKDVTVKCNPQSNGRCEMQCLGEGSCTDNYIHLCGGIATCNGMRTCNSALLQQKEVCSNWGATTIATHAAALTGVDIQAACLSMCNPVSGFGPLCHSFDTLQVCKCLGSVSVPTPPAPLTFSGNCLSQRWIPTPTGELMSLSHSWCDAVCSYASKSIPCTGNGGIRLCMCSDEVSPPGVAPTFPPTPPTSCGSWRSLFSPSVVDCSAVCSSPATDDVCIGVLGVVQLCECDDTPPPTQTTCTQWEPLSIGGIPVDCQALCTSSLTSEVCTGIPGVVQLCVCKDTQPPLSLPPATPPTFSQKLCRSWEIRTGFSSISIDCDSLCVGILNINLCTSFCECTLFDTFPPTAVPTAIPTAIPTAVPTAVPTAIPTAVPTAVPTEVPTAVPTAQPTAVPTTTPGVLQCDGVWRLMVTGGTTNCTALCTNPLTNSVCEPGNGVVQLCECNTLTPVPGTTNVVKRVFQMTLGIAAALLSKTDFERAVESLLNALAGTVTIYWVCPMTACVNGCPTTQSAKISAGCTPGLSLARVFSVLQDSGSVVEFGVDNGATESDTETILKNNLNSNELSAFQPSGLTVSESEVVVVETSNRSVSDDDGLSAGIIAAIVVCSVLFMVLTVVVVYCFACGGRERFSNSDDVEMADNTSDSPRKSRHGIDYEDEITV
eukprot:TRINITY_DN307_c0_g2_i1.p1 TRINITY_DN307_c0_g2~~TRINITY_DN307_c0_g2_i1.p1  ORF type:complete len:2543 (+),score=478.96 TRINITY_DN307_c0_g2_i1:92-7630(+)